MKTYAVVSKHLLLPFVKTWEPSGTDTQIDHLHVYRSPPIQNRSISAPVQRQVPLPH